MSRSRPFPMLSKEACSDDFSGPFRVGWSGDIDRCEVREVSYLQRIAGVAELAECHSAV